MLPYIRYTRGMARPDLSYLKSVFLFLIGLPLGLLSGLSAISGSVFGVPAVRKLLGLRPARAVGVSSDTGVLRGGQPAFCLMPSTATCLWGWRCCCSVFQTLGRTDCRASSSSPASPGAPADALGQSLSS